MTSLAFRPIAALLAVLLPLATLTACSGLAADRELTVLGPWTEREGDAFEQVLDDFRHRTGIRVTYQGTSAVNEVLRTMVQEGSPPDIAVSWSLNDLSRYIRTGHLRPLDAVVSREQREAYQRYWLLEREVGEKRRSIYAIPFKANLKSMIWYRTADLPEKPATWAELVEKSTEIAAGRTPWCLALNHTSAGGWPGTDWIENLLLHRSPDAYRAWVTGGLEWTSPEVTRAWTDWGQIVTRPHLLHGGVRKALLADFGDAGRSMFARSPGCVMQHAPSFAMDGFLRDGEPAAAGEDYDYFPFPEVEGAGGSDGRMANVSVDLAAMFRDTSQARRLIAFLADPKAQRIWPSRRHSSAFSLNTRVPVTVYRGDAVRERISRLLHDRGKTLCLDASDSFPTTMRNAFNRAVLEYVNAPDRLPDLLKELERVHGSIDPQEWVTAACTDGR